MRGNKLLVAWSSKLLNIIDSIVKDNKDFDGLCM